MKIEICIDSAEGLAAASQGGADRVLTSGQEAGAFEGRERIAELQRRAAGRIVVMPGGGITPGNPEYRRQATDPAVVRAVVRQAGGRS